MARVAVVGGGIAGLAAAYELVRRGLDVHLFEASERLGGVIRTEIADGFTIDAGPDSFLVEKRGAVALCEELGVMARAIPTSPPRQAYILRRGRLHRLPPGLMLGAPRRATALATTRLISTRGKLRALLDLVRPVPVIGEDDDASLGALLRPRLGDEVIDWLVEPIVGGIHGGDVDQLSARLVFPQAWSALAAGRGVMRGLGGPARPPSADGVFRSFPGGMAELVGAIASALPDGAVHCGTPVAALTLSPSRMPTIVLANGEPVAVDGVVLATPAHVAAPLVAALDPRVSALAAEVEYRSVTSVVLAYPRAAVAHPLAGSGFLVPASERDCALSAVTWVSSKWPGRAPPGFVLLRAFVGGADRSRLLELDDEALVARAHAELSRLLGVTGAPALRRVYRWPRASAQHTVGHRARIAEIDHRLTAAPRLALAGSGYRAIGIPDGIEDARSAARGLAERLGSLGA